MSRVVGHADLWYHVRYCSIEIYDEIIMYMHCACYHIAAFDSSYGLYTWWNSSAGMSAEEFSCLSESEAVSCI